MAKRTSKSAKPEWPKVVETFRPPGWTIDRLRDDQPSAFNGEVRVRRYRITVELIDEPEQVIKDRLVALWRQTNNHHQREPIRAMAASYGLDLLSEDFGADVPKGQRA